MEYVITRREGILASVRIDISRRGNVVGCKVDGEPATIRTIPEGIDLRRLAEALAAKVVEVIDPIWLADQMEDPGEVLRAYWDDVVASLA